MVRESMVSEDGGRERQKRLDPMVMVCVCVDRGPREIEESMWFRKATHVKRRSRTPPIISIIIICGREERIDEGIKPLFHCSVAEPSYK